MPFISLIYYYEKQLQLLTFLCLFSISLTFSQGPIYYDFNDGVYGYGITSSTNKTVSLFRLPDLSCVTGDVVFPDTVVNIGITL